MKTLSEKIVDWCLKYYQIEDDEYPIIEYGIRLFLNTALKVITLLFIGFEIDYFKEVVIALTVFGCIRNFAGGWHCKTDVGCFVVMLFICLCPLLLFETDLWLAQWIWRTISVYSLYTIIRYAPRNSKVNPICDTQILRKKRIGCFIVCGGAVVFLIFYPGTELRWLVAMPLLIEAVTVSPIFYSREEGILLEK